MTDNDIIKALECCTTNGASCKGCPAFVKVDRSNCKKYFRGAIDLINRQKAEKEALIAGQETLQKYIAEQKAEIERLTKENKNYIKVAETQQSLSMERFFEIKRLTERIEKRTTELDRLTIYFDKAVEEKLKTAKAEAIKEFAERLKEKKFELDDQNEDIFYAVEVADIDNLVKEMVGDGNV